MEHQVNDGILKHLCVHFHLWHLRVASQCEEDSVGCCAYTALEGKEVGRNDTALLLAHEEVCHVLTNLVGDRISILEGTCFVGDVTFNHTHHLLGVKLEIWCTDAVGHFLNWNRLAARRVKGFVHVVQTFRLG